MKKKTSASLPDAEVFFFIATQHIPTFDKKFYQFPNHFFAYHADN